MKCPECGALAADDDEDCPNCGKPLSAPPSEPQESNKYFCEDCNEELEYVTTYQQWYCYNCQKYVDLPAPSEPVPAPEEASDQTPSEEVASEVESETVIPVGPDTIPEQPPSIVSWEDEDSEQEPEKDIKSKEESDKEELDIEDSSESKPSEIELYEATDKAAEISWDEALASEDAASVDLAHEPEIISLDSPDVEDYDPTVDEVTFEEGVGTRVEPEATAPHSPVPEAEPRYDPDESNEEDFSITDNGGASEVEFEIDQSTLEVEYGLKQKSINRLHEAWLRVNNLKGLIPGNEKILDLESDLKSALEGRLDSKDTLVLADESLDDVKKLEKELKDEIHHNISELFHFVNSKMFLAKKIGFNVEELEEELDNVSSLIARGEYHQAYGGLDSLLKQIFDLPQTQNEIMIGLDENSEIMKEFLEPRASPATRNE